MSAKDALLKYSKRSLGDAVREKRSNKKPEKDVEKLVVQRCRKLDLDINVVESKAVYSASAGRYLSGQTDPGFPDIVGDFSGHSVYIELKAKGKRSTLRPSQRDFLERKIKRGCFAVVIDCPDLLEKTLFTWNAIECPAERVKFLLDELPKQRKRKNENGDFPW